MRQEQDAGEPAITIKVAESVAAVDPALWDRLATTRVVAPDSSAGESEDGAAILAVAAPQTGPANPFLSHAFLKSLEDAGCVGKRAGWLPQHMILEDDSGQIIGIAPGYLKSHSQGEYVFDHGWADAFERAGGDRKSVV